MRRSDQVGCSPDANCGCIRKSDHGETAFGRYTLTIKYFRHHGTAEHVIELCKAGRVTIRQVASLDGTASLLSARTQNRCACAATRNIEHEFVTLQAAVPDASSVA